MSLQHATTEQITEWIAEMVAELAARAGVEEQPVAAPPWEQPTARPMRGPPRRPPISSARPAPQQAPMFEPAPAQRIAPGTVIATSATDPALAARWATVPPRLEDPHGNAPPGINGNGKGEGGAITLTTG